MLTSLSRALRRAWLFRHICVVAQAAECAMARGLVSIKRSAVIAVLSGICAACISPSPATQYFSLFAIKQVETQRSELPDKSLSFGVGPIVIPEYMDNPSIVSVSDRQQVQVSGEHAWAGDLRAAMGRVLADNLAQYWVLDKVSAFPWDNRARPAYQLRLVFEEFGGRRGGEVHLRVFWTLLSQQGDKVYLAKRSALLATTAQSSAESYVAALNQLLNQLSYELAIEVRDFLQAENNRAS